MSEKQWVLYILRCRDDTLYTGITDNLSNRLKVHGTAKGAKYTRGRGPFELMYVLPCADHSDALRQELRIKRLTRTQKLALFSNPSAKENG